MPRALRPAERVLVERLAAVARVSVPPDAEVVEFDEHGCLQFLGGEGEHGLAAEFEAIDVDGRVIEVLLFVSAKGRLSQLEFNPYDDRRVGNRLESLEWTAPA